VLFRLAYTYQQEEEPDEAAKYYQDLLRNFPNSEFAEKAKEHLMNTREITGSLKFSGMLITSESTSDPGRNGWYIVVRFSSTTQGGIHVPGPELFIVMLLDGTIAEMTLANGTLIYPFRTSPAAPQLQNRAPQSEVTEPPQ